MGERLIGAQHESTAQLLLYFGIIVLVGVLAQVAVTYMRRRQTKDWGNENPLDTSFRTNLRRIGFAQARSKFTPHFIAVTIVIGLGLLVAALIAWVVR